MNDNIEFVQILLRLHDYFNRKLFGGRLPKPVITLSGEGRRSEGSFWPGRWRTTVSKKGVDEIIIHPERTLSRPFIEVAAIFAHQVMHQAQEHLPDEYGEPGVRDYHTKDFHEGMRNKFGILTEGRGNVKWRITPAFELLMKEFPVPKAVPLRVTEDDSQKSPTKLRLWMCKCPVRVRVATELNARCEDCGAKFKLVK